MKSNAEQRAVNAILLRKIGQVRRRIQFERLLFGLAVIVVSLVIGSFAVSALLAQFNFSQDSVFWTRLIGGVVLLALLFHFFLRPAFSLPKPKQVARFLEERHPELQERLTTAIEMSDESSGVHPEIRRLILDDAGAKLRPIAVPSFYRPRLSFSALSALTLALLVFLALISQGPGFYGYSLNKLLRGWLDDDIAPLYSIEVVPGTATIGKHSDLEVRARLKGFNAEAVRILVRYENEPQWEDARMESDPESGDSVFLFFDVRDPFDYYVAADGIRSDVFRIDVTEVPRILDLKVRLEYPAYSGVSPMVLDNEGDIRALVGTRAVFTLMTDQPVKAGKIKIDSGPEIELTNEGPDSLVGELEVRSDGFYRIHLADLEGVWNPASDEYLIQVLQDMPPSITFRKPGRDRKVTNIEEVFLDLVAEDDYGVRRVDLKFSMNGGETQSLRLSHPRNAKSLTTSHTFFMEEYDLQPGDFISYFATASDAVSTASTDIYFLEVEPFDKEFRQAQQNGQAGQDGQMNLARQQKQIIAATFKLERDRKRMPPDEFEENGQTLALVQQQLQIQAQTIIERIERREAAAASDPRIGKMLEFMKEAIAHMEPAHGLLNELDTQKALPEEQKAYQQLLRAEALFNEVQIAMGQSSSASSAEDLADLVDLELDRKKNQYETLQQNRQQKSEEKLDEALEKLKELAKRQEQEVQRKQRAARSNSGGGASSNQDQLIEEAEELARQLDRLSREKQDRQLAEVSRQLKQAIRDMRQASSTKPDSQESQLRSQQALDQLQRAEDALNNQRESQRQDTVDDLRRRSQDLVDKQGEILDKVSGLRQQAESGQLSPDFSQQRRELDRLKDEAREDVSKLEGDLHEAARQMTSTEPASAKKLKQAALSIRDERIGDQMTEGGIFMQRGWFPQAETREKGVQRDLQRMSKMVEDAQQALGEGKAADPSEKLQQAQNELGSLIENLESLKQRAEAAQRGEEGERGEQGQRQGQDQQSSEPGQQGQQGKEGDQQGEQGKQGEGESEQGRQPGQNGRPGQQGERQGQGQPGETGRESNQSGGHNPGSADKPSQQSPADDQPRSGREGFAISAGGLSNNTGIDPRQIGRELREREGDLRDIRGLLGESPDMLRDANELLRYLSKLNAERLFSDPEEIARLRSQIIDGLHQLELEINQALLESSGQRVRFADPEEVPPQFRRQVEDYYRSLATKKKQN